MIVAVTAQGPEPACLVDPRFGRCKYFMLYDEATEAYTARTNEQNLQAAQGAGVQAAQNTIDAGAGVVITGHLGPKAFRALSANGVCAYRATDMTVSEAVAAFFAGRLAPLEGADTDGHWI